MITAISQSVGVFRGNQYDFLYKDYTVYLEQFGFRLIKVSNFSKFNNYKIKRIILSGGNSLNPKLYGSAVKIDDASKERDEAEAKLLKIALKRRIPVLGICRGMQFINVFFGGKLKKIKGHVGVGHFVDIGAGKSIRVNSYHNYGLTQKELSPHLKVFAVSLEDGVIEGIYHEKYPIVGIQWHPERKGGNSKLNKKIINAFYHEGNNFSSRFR